MKPTSGVRSSNERGQILAIFALAMVTIVAMTGLVLDGGFTFVQRRDQQNVADAAALAAAYAYGNNGSSTTAATTAALTQTAANGDTNGTRGVVVTVTLDAARGARPHITVRNGQPH